MKFFKKFNAALALALSLMLISPVALPSQAVVQADAATIKINATKKTLKVGKTFQLKITGTKKTVTWKSSKPAVASVNKKGKVTAKAAGKTNITAKVAGKKFVCKITVKDTTNPALPDAPFDAKEVKAEGYSFVVPKNWASDSATQNGIYTYVTAPSEQGGSNLIIAMQPAGNLGEVDYSTLKEILMAQNTEALLKSALESQGFENPVISNYKTSDVKTPLGTSFCLSYDVAGKMQGQDISLSQCVYIIPTDSYLIAVTGTELEGTDSTPSIKEVTDYAVQSFVKQN